MKKSVSIIFASAIALSTVFVGCKKEITESTDPYIEGERVTFTAQIISGDNASKSTAGLAGATVTLYGAGEAMSATTDAGGFAAFDNLEVGSYAMSVSMANYTSLNATISVWSGSGDNTYATGQFTIFSMSSTVAGVVYLNTDATNDTSCFTTNAEPVIPTGTNNEDNDESCDPDMAGTSFMITARCDENMSNWVSGSGNMTIDDIAYDGLNSTVACAADGSYSLTVGGTASGLDYEIMYPSYAVQQKVWDEVAGWPNTTTARMTWGSNSWWVTTVSGVTYINDEV